ncbi:hypothetical protein SUGI_0371590 [Cryptomeria japonica]|nr:hypothetical protein SUGI_0371590 [Cryptomeria japonica]
MESSRGQENKTSMADVLDQSSCPVWQTILRMSHGSLCLSSCRIHLPQIQQVGSKHQHDLWWTVWLALQLSSWHPPSFDREVHNQAVIGQVVALLERAHFLFGRRFPRGDVQIGLLG